MRIRDRIKLALAVLFGAEIPCHLDSADQAILKREVEHQFCGPEDMWMVEPIPSVWVPVRFRCGKSDSIVNIAPVLVPVHKRVTVVRW